ncbi:MAG: hypothetical protein WC466_03890 [Candidatus Izemoplasmatales bacterium]
MEGDIKFLKPKDFCNLGDDWKDIYVEIKNIKRGDVFFECERGNNYQLKAITNSRRISDGWYCVVENTTGERFEIFVSDMTCHPGPNLFKEPRFITKQNKEVVYLVN